MRQRFTMLAGLIVTFLAAAVAADVTSWSQLFEFQTFAGIVVTVAIAYGLYRVPAPPPRKRSSDSRETRAEESQ